MKIQDLDLRLLRVFQTVVDAGGFSNAQAALNASLSTISTQMSHLEGRLGYRLCDRGRAGFRLTYEGEMFYGHVLDFFESLHIFERRSRRLRDRLDGVLRIGFLDNVATDSNDPLQCALDRFTTTPDNHVHLRLESLAPARLEQRLLDHSLDLAVGIFNHRLPALCYEPLYSERDILVCSPSHEFAGVPDALALAQSIREQPHVARSFLDADEFPFDTENSEDRPCSEVVSIEASLMLIRTGRYFGFLPEHYARGWIERGDLVALFPDRYTRRSTFHLVTRRTSEDHAAPVQTFLDCLKAACNRRHVAA